MQDIATVANPFALMLDPASVIAAVERSERLARLHSTICRPLDKVKLEGATAAERAEIRELRAELERVTRERDILGKAVAYFSASHPKNV